MESIASAQIRVIIKNLLKKRGATYEDLGEAIGLTLAGMKRLMTKGDFTLNRLEQIAAWFGLSLLEFLAIARDTVVRPYEFSKEQEAILAKKPRALHLLLLLGAGFPLAEAAERMKLKKTDLQADLFTLDKINAIELGSEDRVRILARGPYRWQPDGALRKKYQIPYLRQLGGLLEPEPAKDTLQLAFELYLSQELTTQMQNELRIIFEKYRSLSRVNHEVSPSKEINPISGLILVKPFDSWGAMLQEK